MHASVSSTQVCLASFGLAKAIFGSPSQHTVITRGGSGCGVCDHVVRPACSLHVVRTTLGLVAD